MVSQPQYTHRHMVDKSNYIFLVWKGRLLNRLRSQRLRIIIRLWILAVIVRSIKKLHRFSGIATPEIVWPVDMDFWDQPRWGHFVQTSRRHWTGSRSWNLLGDAWDLRIWSTSQAENPSSSCLMGGGGAKIKLFQYGHIHIWATYTELYIQIQMCTMYIYYICQYVHIYIYIYICVYIYIDI